MTVPAEIRYAAHASRCKVHGHNRDGDRVDYAYSRHPTAEVSPLATIFPGVYIGPNVRIGDGCVICPNTSIGQPGYGYTRTELGQLRYRPHTKGVVIEPDVHIGANTSIDQGRHRPTIIRTGTRIDNQVHIAHNVIVGRHCAVIAHAMLAGTVELKDFAYVAPGAQIRDHVTVGRRAMVGQGAVVLEDVPAGEVWAGVPARKLRDAA